MDNELLVQNIIKHCDSAKVAPTVACKASGAGKDLIGNIRKGQTPSAAKIADLAAYLGVTTSDLVGDKVEHLPEFPPDLQQLSDTLDELNEEGRERLLEYADDLVKSGKYKKADKARMGSQKGAV